MMTTSAIPVGATRACAADRCAAFAAAVASTRARRRVGSGRRGRGRLRRRAGARRGIKRPGAAQRIDADRCRIRCKYASARYQQDGKQNKTTHGRIRKDDSGKDTSRSTMLTLYGSFKQT
jgi:hypothetical protein